MLPPRDGPRPRARRGLRPDGGPAFQRMSARGSALQTVADCGAGWPRARHALGPDRSDRPRPVPRRHSAAASAVHGRDPDAIDRVRRRRGPPADPPSSTSRSTRFMESDADATHRSIALPSRPPAAKHRAGHRAVARAAAAGSPAAPPVVGPTPGPRALWRDSDPRFVTGSGAGHPDRPRARFLSRARQGPQGADGPLWSGSDGLPWASARHSRGPEIVVPTRPPRRDPARAPAVDCRLCAAPLTPFARRRGGPYRSAWGCLRETETRSGGRAEELTTTVRLCTPARVQRLAVFSTATRS